MAGAILGRGRGREISRIAGDKGHLIVAQSSVNGA